MDLTFAGTDTTQTFTNKTYTAAIFTGGWTASGSTSFDLSGSTATFKTPTGLTTVSGDATVAGVTTPTGGVAAAGGYSVSPRTFHSGGVAASSSTMGTDTTPATTTTYICEVFIPANCTVTGVAVLLGSAAAGNMTVGLADSSGAPIAAAVSASTTAGSTPAIFLRIPFSVAYAAKGPATYWITVQTDNTSNRLRTHAWGNFGTTTQTGGTYGIRVSFSPPTTFTTNVGPICTLY